MLLILMSSEFFYVLARLVALIHLLYVLFVVLGLIYIYLGALFKVKLVRNVYFRTVHLFAMMIVAVQQYYMLNCPLTVLEKRLLFLAEKPIYKGAFVAHTLGQFQFNIPTAYYLPLYISLSVLFIASFVIIPPKLNRFKIKKINVSDLLNDLMQ